MASQVAHGEGPHKKALAGQMVRGGVTQPARTMPEQDETGKGHSGPHSGVPIRRQLAARLREVAPRRSGNTGSFQRRHL